MKASQSIVVPGTPWVDDVERYEVIDGIREANAVAGEEGCHHSGLCSSARGRVTVRRPRLNTASG